MTKILIVEDADELREHVIEYLLLRDYEVFEAENGQEGIKAALQHQPDIILCDVIMPELDGYGMLRQIRSHPKTAHVPFIFLTARTSSSDMRHAMQLGANDYLTKPFKFDELQVAIEAHIDKSQQLTDQVEPEVTTAVPTLADNRFLSNVLPGGAHNIKSLMTVIISSVYLMREYADKLSPEQRERHLLQVLRSSYRMLEILDNMMTFSRFDHSEMQVETEPLQISEMLRELVAGFRDRDVSRHELMLDYADCAQVLVQAEEGMIRHALTNLLSNAIQYSPEDSVVTISLQRDGEKLNIRITDEGVGLSEDEISNAFALFSHNASADIRSGAGLGLAIVQLVATAHGGSVSVDSVPEQGSTFTLSLPIHAG